MPAFLFQDGNVLIVSGLQPASVYRLEVRVISAEGEGPATSRTFQTPGPQSVPKQSENSHWSSEYTETFLNVVLPFFIINFLHRSAYDNLFLSVFI